METRQQKEIRKLVENWAEAVRNVDRPGILGHHSSDIVMFDVPAPLQSLGIEAYEKTWDLFFQHSEGGDASFVLEELRITASDTVAFCHALLRIGGSEPVCRLTIGLQKNNSEWYITHEHHSAPHAL